jgi:phosphoserine phosphatase
VQKALFDAVKKLVILKSSRGTRVEGCICRMPLHHRTRILTLIAAPAAASLLPDIAATIAAAWQAEVHWLSPGEACDVPLEPTDAPAAEALARQAIGGAPIDTVVQPAEGRRKRILVADMESTIIENEMLDELADFIGLRAHVAEITRRAMNGELDFVGALTERVALLKGLPASLIDQAATRIRIMPGASELVATMRAAGAVTALVSGGFTVFAERVGVALGFDRVVANRIDIADGRLLGTVQPPIATSATKRDTLLALARECGVAAGDTLAVGDGANDLPMLLEAGLGIAFHAKPSVAAASGHRIDHADLTALLYAQGYRREEITRSLQTRRRDRERSEPLSDKSATSLRSSQ